LAGSGQAESEYEQQNMSAVRHLLKRMYDELGPEAWQKFVDRVSSGEHDVRSPWATQSQPVIEPLVSEQLLDELIAPLKFDKQSAGYLAIQELRQFRKAQKDLGK
jgi:hypothetical protein